MKSAHDIIISPIISERSMEDAALRKYTFKVALTANKIEIKKAIEEVFPGVKVESVNTQRVLGKVKRQGLHEGKRADWKKAIVTITEQSKTIEFFESLV